MKKQILAKTINEKDYIVYELKKQQSFFNFLLELFDALNIKKPDLYDEHYKLDSINDYLDSIEIYEGDKAEVQIVYGLKKIFLIVKTTELRDNLIKFMKQNCEFYKSKEGD